MFYLIALFALLGVGLVAAGWRESKTNSPASAATRIAKFQQRGQAPSEEEVRAQTEKDFARREEERVAKKRSENTLPAFTRMVSSHALLSRLDADLMQVKSRWRAAELLAFSILISMVTFAATAFMGFPIPISIVAALVCLGLPWGYVKFVRMMYYRRFDEQLADTLMLMANGLRAGFSFLQALEMVSRETRPPIADEFGRVTQEIAVGVPVQEALLNLSQRVPSMDLNLMVTAVIIQREVGGGLAEVLEIIAAVIRERMRIKREIRVLTTQGRMTGAILGMLPIALGFAIHFTNKLADPLSPSFIQPLFETAFGRNLLYVGLALQAIGFMIIMKIVAIRV